ncbi:MAG: phosphodiester glycosidase family protein [Candidatus Riflebacteria bacterium]|nr:phosphodiester glycosidase family protein [Candidatus Riflebacteria bacterium]
MPIVFPGKMFFGGHNIRRNLRQLLLLLIIGQIFLVGAVMQTEQVVYNDVEEWDEENTRQLDMRGPSSSGKDAALDQLEEDQMPEPESAPEDTVVQPEILSVKFRTEEAFEVVEFELSQSVRVLRRSQGGKLLRMRIMPGLRKMNPEFIEQLQQKFNKFSLHQTNKYSEMVFSARGRIGDPYTASETSGIFRVCVPYQLEKAKFALTVGEKVVDGVTYYRDRAKTGAGCSDVHILRVEPFSTLTRIFPVLAHEGIAQKETLSSMAKRYEAIAGINGAYFTPRGDPIGTLIINRRLISSPLYKRSVFGVSEDDTLIFGNPDFTGTLRSGTLSVAIDAVNQPRRGEQLVVYTPEYARSTLTPERGVEIVLVKGKIVGIHANDALIPPDGVVVSAGGEKAELLKSLKLGQTVTLDYSIDKPWDTIRHAVCGGPRLVSDGRKDINGRAEKFDNSIINGRHPRTAVALTFDGDLLMIVVDGRSKRNSGMKLDELADYLRLLGARHAINLDGGGSSSMIVKGRTVNSPSDGNERRISNGILITSR